MLRTGLIWVIAAVWTLAVFWAGAQLAGTGLADDIDRVLTEHSERSP